MSATRWVDLAAPGWLGGGDPRAYLEKAGLVVRGGKSERFRVCTEEHYVHGQPHLVTSKDLTIQISEIGRLAATERTTPPQLSDSRSQSALEAVFDAMLRGELGALADYSSAVVSTSAPEHLQAAVENILGLIGRVTEKGSDVLVYPAPGALLITRDDKLLHRSVLMRMFLRLEQDERTAQGNLLDIERAMEANGLGFTAAAHGLGAGVYMIHLYLGPLLGSIAPLMWGYATAREFGAVLFTFGRTVVGCKARAVELLQTLQHRGGRGGPPRTSEQVTPRNIISSVDWWVARLNRMFAWLTDFTVFVRKDGRYNPSRQLQMQLTVDQVFRRVASISANSRDDTTGLVLMYSVLDSISGRLSDADLVKLLTPRLARRTFERLRQQLPADTHPILLPTAERAVDALDEVIDGFYIPSARANPGYITFALSNGQTHEVGEQAAVATYLSVLRNATHGFGPKSGNTVGKFKTRQDLEEAILVHHDGHLKPEIFGLAYLYLLDFLANPDAAMARTVRQSASE